MLENSKKVRRLILEHFPSCKEFLLAAEAADHELFEDVDPELIGLAPYEYLVDVFKGQILLPTLKEGFRDQDVSSEISKFVEKLITTSDAALMEDVRSGVVAVFVEDPNTWHQFRKHAGPGLVREVEALWEPYWGSPPVADR